MRHTIEITEDWRVVLEGLLEPTCPARPRQLVNLVAGEQRRCEVRCYAEDLGWGRVVEVAEITLPEGGTLLRVPCHCFQFLDN
jgi:hypothetical protein